MANHTPGPWRRDGWQIVGADGKKILTVGFSKHASWPDQDEAEANMQLIVAALEKSGG